MGSTRTVLQAPWWRADRYELHDDIVDAADALERQVEPYIAPAPGARWERYDLFAPTPLAAGSSRADALHGLLELAGEFRAKPTFDLSRLVDWVSKNGLLGLLTQQVSMVTLAPRVTPRESDGQPIPASIRYLRGAAGWG